MSHTTTWLDSFQSLGDDMPDSNSDRHLFKVLGSLGSDVKHTLSLIERSRDDTAQLKADLKSDMVEVRADFKALTAKMAVDYEHISMRVDKLETFQTKVIAWAMIIIPAAIVVGQALAPAVLALL